MSLFAEIFLAWLLGVPSVIVVYALLSHRYFDWRLLRRRSAEGGQARVVSIAVARGVRTGRPHEPQHKTSLSA